jgi:nitronate monooxygenase
VQAPMAGLPPPELVAAVSGAGGLGSLGAAFLAPEELRSAVNEVRELTDRPFNVNLFAWEDPDEPAPDAVSAVETALRPYRRGVGISDGALASVPTSPSTLLRGQLAVVAEERVPVVSFTFGIPPLDDVKQAGAAIVATATTVEEALALQRAGVDAIVAQSAEAGGHRGSFLAPVEESLIGGFALIPQIADAVDVPVVAAGAIMDGRGIAAAMALGAQAAQLGTAFLATRECSAHPLHKAALSSSTDTATCVTAVYSGRPARTVRTAFIADLEAILEAPLPFPLQFGHTGPLHGAGADQGRADLMFLLAGQAAAMARELPAADLVDALVREVEAVLRVA